MFSSWLSRDFLIFFAKFDQLLDSPLDLESWKLNLEKSEHLGLIPWVISTNYIPRKLAAGALLGSWFVDRCFSFYQADFLGPGHNKIQTLPPPDTGRSIKSLEGQKIYDIYYWEEVQLGRGRAFGYSIDTSSKKFLKPGDSLNQTYMIVYVMIKVVRARTPSCCLKLQ